jgi:hypothetical protein
MMRRAVRVGGHDADAAVALHPCLGDLLGVGDALQARLGAQLVERDQLAAQVAIQRAAVLDEQQRGGAMNGRRPPKRKLSQSSA